MCGVLCVLCVLCDVGVCGLAAGTHGDAKLNCCWSCSSCSCEGEVIVIRLHLLGESAQVILLLNLREAKGQEDVLEDKDDEEKESEGDEKVKEVRENAQLMHATW